MEEVVAGGAVLGSIRFLAVEGRWEPIPRPEAASYLTPRRRYVVVDRGAVPSIVNGGASVLAPGLLEIEPSVKKGDEVFVLDEEKHCIAVGRAKVDAGETEGIERGSIVRTRKNTPSTCIPRKASWEDAVNANAAVIGEKEAASVHFIREVAGRHPLPVNVSYSGGKDSLATLLLVRKALGAVPLLFADTGLELPETYANVQEVAGRYGLPIVEVSGEEAFCELSVVLPEGKARTRKAGHRGALGGVPLLCRPAAVRVVPPESRPAGVAEPARGQPGRCSPHPDLDCPPCLALPVP
jgi:phosphoadenosine phosphosulfate reductase